VSRIRHSLGKRHRYRFLTYPCPISRRESTPPLRNRRNGETLFFEGRFSLGLGSAMFRNFSSTCSSTTSPQSPLLICRASPVVCVSYPCCLGARGPSLSFLSSFTCSAFFALPPLAGTLIVLPPRASPAPLPAFVTLFSRRPEFFEVFAHALHRLVRSSPSAAIRLPQSLPLRNVSLPLFVSDCFPHYPRQRSSGSRCSAPKIRLRLSSLLTCCVRSSCSFLV